MAVAEGLHAFYVPSMRNGEKTREDRGNAILSTLPLSDPVILELPHERQRRVAAGVRVEGVDADGEPFSLRFLSVHLENRSRFRAFRRSFGRGRARQARWLASQLGDEEFVVRNLLFAGSADLRESVGESFVKTTIGKGFELLEFSTSPVSETARPLELRATLRRDGYVDLLSESQELEHYLMRIRLPEVEKDQDLEAGATVTWGITPNITLNAALNPDFSQIEADAVRLSLNERFEIYFEERRPFFLESADYFQTDMRLFYTRMIADPLAALKLTKPPSELPTSTTESSPSASTTARTSSPKASTDHTLRFLPEAPCPARSSVTVWKRSPSDST